MSPEFLLTLGSSVLVGVFSGLGTYVAVRVEIAVLSEKVSRMSWDLDHLKSKLGEL